MTNKPDLRKLIAKWLVQFVNDREGLNVRVRNYYCEEADRILELIDTPEGQEWLKSKGWVQLDEDQSLPKTLIQEGTLCYMVFEQTQESILKAGFRRVKNE